MTNETKERIDRAIASSRVLLFMKGNREIPMCGFSAAVVGVLEQLAVPYETIDVLEDPEIREGIKEFSNWPTIPQLYVDSKFVGGSDIVREMYRRGELEPLVREALESDS